MLQRTLLVLLIAACTLSSGCDTSRRVLGHVLVPDETEIELGTQLAAQIEAQQRLHPDRSHPPTGERIRRIERLIDQYGASRGQRYQARFVRETAVLRRK